MNKKREAISIKAKEKGKVRGITIRECFIHDIWGQNGGDAGSRMIDISHVEMMELTKVNDVLIEFNKIQRCDKV